MGTPVQVRIQTHSQQAQQTLTHLMEPAHMHVCMCMRARTHTRARAGMFCPDARTKHVCACTSSQASRELPQTDSSDSRVCGGGQPRARVARETDVGLPKLHGRPGSAKRPATTLRSLKCC